MSVEFCGEMWFGKSLVKGIRQPDVTLMALSPRQVANPNLIVILSFIKNGKSMSPGLMLLMLYHLFL